MEPASSVASIQSLHTNYTRANFSPLPKCTAQNSRKKTGKEHGACKLLLLAECCAVVARTGTVEEAHRQLIGSEGAELLTEYSMDSKREEQVERQLSVTPSYSEASTNWSSYRLSNSHALTTTTVEALTTKHGNTAVMESTNLLLSESQQQNHILPPSYCYRCGDTISYGVHHYCDPFEFTNNSASASADFFLEPAHAAAMKSEESLLPRSGHGDLRSRTPIDISTFTSGDNITRKEQGHSPSIKLHHYSPNQNRKSPYGRYATYQLNRLFFETFGSDRNITYLQRRMIEEKTGVVWKKLSKGIYYRKCHYQAGLQLYKQLVRAGKVTGYKSFLEYCKTHRVPTSDGHRYGIPTDF